MAAHTKSLTKGFVAGALGGAIGTFVLNVFQAGSLKATEAVEDQAATGHSNSQQQKDLLDTYNQAHAKAATAVAGAAGQQLSPPQQQAAIPAVEFAFGILCGGVYGALAEYLPVLTSGFGGAFGAVLFTGASEVVLPALGWVPGPAERTPVQHGGGLAGNVVYGVSTEAVRRLLR